MPGLPRPEYLTKKQVRALNRAIKRAGEGPIKIGMCRIVSNRKVEVCRSREGYYVSSSPRKRAVVQGTPRHRRIHGGY